MKISERPHHASYSHKSSGYKSTRPASVLPAVRILTTVFVMSVFTMSVLIDLTWAEVVFLTSKARDNPPNLFIALSRMLVIELNVRGSIFLSRCIYCDDEAKHTVVLRQVPVQYLHLSFVALSRTGLLGFFNFCPVPYTVSIPIFYFWYSKKKTH